MGNYDRIEKELVLHAPIERVWRAITDITQFSEWFGIRLDQPFAPGRTVTGTFAQEFDELGIRAYHKSLGIEPTGIRRPKPNDVFCTVEQMEEPHLFSFRWVPYGLDIECDPEREPTTLVEFNLESVVGGTRLKITETGFEGVPAHRRQRAFLMNDGGWSAQIENIRRHVERD